MELRAKLQNVLKETAQIEEHSKTTEKECQEVYASLDDSRQHIVQLREQLDEMNAQKTHLQKLADEKVVHVRELGVRMSQLEGEIRHLQDENRRLKEAGSSSPKVNGDVGDIEMVVSLQKKLNEVNSVLSERDHLIQKLSEENLRQKEELSSLSDDFSIQKSKNNVSGNANLLFSGCCY
ncbi:unnamed protein product [Darwinula stevensoni]|uniref:Uncharacterized protein n=1 Tax=Darwinula stevensoni TaxID=69355 RepID=A0A7R9ADU0_9CRUS|nr:unnamed protein product [Darwinula stevensoni]CAG0901636.1 unnamed protein product [Darwinula stevensoni]